jgi:hypothetical protein
MLATPALARHATQALLLPDMCWERNASQLMSADALTLLRRKALALPEGLRHLAVVMPQPLVGIGAAPASSMVTSSDSAAACAAELAPASAGTQAPPAPAPAPASAPCLADGWGASEQRGQQRVQLVQALQQVAAARKLRVSLVSGAGLARCCWVGKMHSHPKEGLKEDPRFMQQVGRERGAWVSRPSGAWTSDRALAGVTGTRDLRVGCPHQPCRVSGQDPTTPPAQS